jgi:integrase
MVELLMGLRPGEVRGLRWGDWNAKARTLSVRRRADQHGEISRRGAKTNAGNRVMGVADNLAAYLNAHRERSRFNKDEDYIFATDGGGYYGTVRGYNSLKCDGLYPTLLAAGLATIKTDKDGNEMRNPRGLPIIDTKYTQYAFRHHFASRLINPPERGGLGLPVEEVCYLMGHSGVQVTWKTYYHMFKAREGTNVAKMNALEKLMREVNWPVQPKEQKGGRRVVVLDFPKRRRT